MNDQARTLRGLMERSQSHATARAPSPARAFSIAVTSGKGGVGKSHLALNLALALRRQGASACVLDANPGLGNIDLLCGLNGYWNLSHVVIGARTLPEVLLHGPEGLPILPGATGLQDLAEAPPRVARELRVQLTALEAEFDFLIVDAGSGWPQAVRDLATAAQLVLVVTTPEPTSIADAYATIKALPGRQGACEPHLLVNQADSAEQAREIIARVQHTARTFLHVRVSSAGFIPRDSAVARAVARRVPFLVDDPRGPAAQGVEQLARRLNNLSQAAPREGSFFARLCPAPGREAIVA